MAVRAPGRHVQPGANTGLLGADPGGLEARRLNPGVGVLDDPLIDDIGDNQNQIGLSLQEMGADRVGVKQTKREDEVLAGDAMIVAEEFTGVHNDPQAQPCSVRSSSVVACKAADKPRQEGMQQPSLGDLGIEQDYNAVAVLGLRDTVGIDPRGCNGVPEDVVQARTHSGSRGIAPVQAAEALDVDRQDAPCVPVLHACTNLPITTFQTDHPAMNEQWTSRAGPTGILRPRQGLPAWALSSLGRAADGQHTAAVRSRTGSREA
jgi:hypothetical protein